MDSAANLIKAHWQVLAIIIFYSIFNFYTFDLAGPSADAGTHALLGLFYHDLIRDWFAQPTFSFSKIYNYGITYLTYYPKITIYYPPFFHLLVSLSYFIFGVSFFSAKIVEISFSVLSLFSVYLLGKELFEKKVGLLATIVLMTSPIFVFWSRDLLIDIPLIFYFTITAFLYIRWLKKKDKASFFLGVIFGSFGLLTKWQFLIIFPILFLYTAIAYRKKLLPLLASFMLTFLVMSPYLLVSFKIGALSLQYEAGVQTGESMNFPKWNELAAWTYYLEVFLFKKPDTYHAEQFMFPLSLLIMISFLYYLFKGKEHRAFVLIWVAVFYIFFVFFDIKQDRFTMPYLQIFSIVFASVFFNFINKHKKYTMLVSILLGALIVAQFYYSIASLPHFSEPVDGIVSDLFEPNSNILVSAYSPNVHDSIFAYTLAKYDRSFRTRYYRYCSVQNISSLDTFGIKYVVIGDPHSKSLDQFANIVYNNPNLFDKVREYELGDESFSVFEYKGFKPTQNKCNYVCFPGEVVCTPYDKPIDALK